MIESLGNQKIKRALNKLATLETSTKQLVKKAQINCHHTRLGECEHQELYCSSLPPMRICLDCGLTEEGWGCGYLLLIGEVYKVSRDNVYSLRTGFSLREEHKGPLLRHEKTVADLIEESNE